jgi:hypothetical protein
MDAALHQHQPKLFRPPGPEMTKTEIQESYNRYVRLYEEQEDILANNRDFVFLEELIPKLPNLRGIVMSDGNGLRIIHKTRPVPKRDISDLYSGTYDDGAASARHLRALLKGVEKAGTQLQSIQASLVHLSILDETQFGLHNISPGLLGHLTTLKLGLVAVDEEEVSGATVQDQDFVSQLTECRALMRKGSLRRTLDKMPNLVDLNIELAEFNRLPFGTFPSPAYLRDVIPLDRVWPKLKRFSISNVETERQQIVGFLVRHKSSLESFDLGFIRLTSTSWRKLLPDLKSQFHDCGRLKSARLLDVILGKSEDEFEHSEGWYLGNPDHGLPNPLCKAVTKYLLLPQRRRCPLNGDNMLEEVLDANGLLPDSDDEWSTVLDESEFVHGDEIGVNAGFLSGLAGETRNDDDEEDKEREEDDSEESS